VQRGFLEVSCVGRQYLPVGHRHIEHLNRPHAWKLATQAVMVLGRCRQPYSVVRGMVAVIAQDQHDLFLHVDRKTSEHRLRDGIH